MKKIIALLGLFAFQAFGITNVVLPYLVDTASIPKVRYVDKNDSALKWGINNLGDTVNAASGTGVLLRTTSPTITTPTISGTVPGTTAFTNTTTSGTALTTGAHTFTAAPIFSSVTASQFLLVDASKVLTSTAGTGSGSVVRATSPTLVTPALGAATATSVVASGNIQAAKVGAGVAPSYGVDVETLVGITAAKFGVTTPLYLGSPDPIIGFNAYYNLGWKYGAGSSSKYAGNFDFNPTTGSLSFGATASSGNADGAATMTDVFTLSKAGAAVFSSTVTADSLISSKFYTEGTFTLSAGGFSACTLGSLSGGNCNVTASYVRVGKQVTVLVPSISGTSNGVTMLITGWPAAITPAATSLSQSIGQMTDNGVKYPGTWNLSSGSFFFGYFSAINTHTSSYTGSGTKGVTGFSITYTLQ